MQSLTPRFTGLAAYGWAGGDAGVRKLAGQLRRQAAASSVDQGALAQKNAATAAPASLTKRPPTLPFPRRAWQQRDRAETIPADALIRSLVTDTPSLHLSTETRVLGCFVSPLAPLLQRHMDRPIRGGSRGRFSQPVSRGLPPPRRCSHRPHKIRLCSAGVCIPSPATSVRWRAGYAAVYSTHTPLGRKGALGQWTGPTSCPIDEPFII